VTAKYGAAATPEDHAIAAAATDYWVAFAKTGNPNVAGRPAWPAYTAAADAIMDFTLTGPTPGPDPRKARLDLVERLASTPPQP
jgi:para-nitrobenzyl esterase